MPYRKRRPRSSINRNKKRFNSEKIAMLKMRDVAVFEYDIRQILEESSMDEDSVNAFVANLITKASRWSLEKAKEYVREVAEQGVFSESTSDRICSLLDRNKKYR